MLMSNMTPAFCAKQLGHSVEIFLKTYTKWLDGEQDNREMERLEKTLSSPVLPPQNKSGTPVPDLYEKIMGWLMGLEPTTTGITILDSTN